ncbi:MAG TPA: MMPL family transporter [Acidimicrobiia bacterium]|nr:MMPL family transporter [Acidimicrobiia bacterium]
MHKVWGWLGLNLGKHWVASLLIGAVLTLGFGFGITKLEFSTSQNNYLNKSDQVYKDNVAYQNLFGGEAMVTLLTMDPGHKVNELFTKENIAKWKAAEDKIRANPGVLDVVSPLTALEWNDKLIKGPNGDVTQGVAGKILTSALTREKTAAGKAARTADATKTIARINAIPVDQRTIDNPKYLDFLLYDNAGNIREPLLAFFPPNPNDPSAKARHAQMVTRLKGNQSIEDEGKAADFIAQVSKDDLQFANSKLVSTGAPELLKNVNDYLTGGMATLALISIGIMTLILLLLFSVRWRLLPLGVVLIGVVWAFGIAGYLGIPLTIVTIAGLPVMLGIGIDYAIQMHARVEEEVVIDRADHPIQETARSLGPALLVVTFDAIFAFAALRFAKVPMLREFGLLLIIGVTAICINSIMAPLSILGIREFKSPTKGRDFREGPLGRLTVWLGSLTDKIAPWMAILSVLVFAGGLLVEGKLVLQTDPIQWVNQKSRVIKDLNQLDAQTGSSSELGVYVQSKNPFDDKTVGFLDNFSRTQLKENSETLLTASGLVPVVSQLLDVPGAPHLAPTAEDVKNAYDVAPKDIQMSTVSPANGALNVIFRTGPSGLDARAKVVREIRKTVHPPAGVAATPSGLAVVGVGLLDNLEANRIVLTYIAILFVFLFLAVRLRSIIRALLSLVPVLIAVGLSSLVAYAFSLKLSPMTAVGGPLVVAACTEFTSLILLRFVEERRRGLAPREAVDVTAARTGRAFIVSALTAISGVAVIATSSLPLLHDFGLIVAMNVAVALLSALVILPPMLVWADKRNWVSKGLVPADVLMPTASAKLAESVQPAHS